MREGNGTLFDLLPVLGVLYLGPRIDCFHLPLLLYMPCDAMLLFCCLRTFTILYCVICGTFYAEWASPVTLSGL